MQIGALYGIAQDLRDVHLVSFHASSCTCSELLADLVRVYAEREMRPKEASRN